MELENICGSLPKFIWSRHSVSLSVGKVTKVECQKSVAVVPTRNVLRNLNLNLFTINFFNYNINVMVSNVLLPFRLIKCHFLVLLFFFRDRHNASMCVCLTTSFCSYSSYLNIFQCF